MALTPNERKSLQLARENIAEGGNVHLCYALTFVANNTAPDLWRDCNRLKQYVMRAIHPFVTLDDWIAYHEVVKPVEEQRIPNTLQERREARVQWIDYMLGKRLSRIRSNLAKISDAPALGLYPHQQTVHDSLMGKTRRAEHAPVVTVRAIPRIETLDLSRNLTTNSPRDRRPVRLDKPIDTSII